MEIWMGNFWLWRLKKFIVFLLCMISAVIFTVIIDNGIFILLGIIIYGVLIEAFDVTFFKTKYLANIYADDKEIIIITKNKKLNIEVNRITDVIMKDIKYGGKWLDIIGYRLIIVTKEKKYFFDSTFIDESNYNDIFKLQEMIQSVKTKCFI